MHFQYIWLLPLLLVIPPLVAGAVMAAFARKQALIASYGERKLTQKGTRTMTRFLAWTRAATAALGVAMMIVALARPAIDNGRVEFPQGSTDVIVMVDVSRSMAATDYKGRMPQGSLFSHGTRLDMARHLIREDVVPALGANRLGIVTFAGEAFPLAPLTQDASAVDWMQIRAATISSAPGEGSALVKAFATAFKLFDLDSDPHHKKIIILYSDGGNDDGLDDLMKVVQELHNRNIELVVVGLGKTTPSPIPTKELSPQDQYSGTEFYIDKNGEVAMSQLDENVLRLLANRAGGRYVRVNAASDFSFSSLAQRLDMQYIKGQQQLFVYPLMLSVLLLGIAWFLGDEVLKSIRKRDED
jgi:Ca-activated chloride channel family protein